MNSFFIKGRFNLTGRGLVYVLLIPETKIISIVDILIDECNNRFKVKAIHMHRHCTELVNEYEGYPVGFSFENIDEVEVQGEYLFA